MRVAKALALAFTGPATVIVAGSVWGNMLGWDLTQPQAVVIAAVIGGPFLIVAAWLAFTGQAQNRQEERDKFDEQMKFEREKFEQQLKEQRKQAIEQLDMQAKITNATNEMSRKIEESKHRREVVFASVSAAINRLLELRTAYVEAQDALQSDFEEQAENGPPYDDEAWLPHWIEARKKCERARNELNATAATFLVLDIEDSYQALMDVTSVVGEKLNEAPPRYFSDADLKQFAEVYVKAIDSLRHKYERA